MRMAVDIGMTLKPFRSSEREEGILIYAYICVLRGRELAVTV